MKLECENGCGVYEPVTGDYPECPECGGEWVKAPLQPLSPSRTCGSCTECCRVIAIATPELVKPADTACVHCSVAAGCSIYASRPPVCRTFECAWLASPSAFDDDQRPDITGVIISNPQPPIPSRLFDCQVLVAHECWPDATAAGSAGNILVRALASSGAIVFGALRGTRGLLVTAPSAELAQAALEAAMAISRELELTSAAEVVK